MKVSKVNIKNFRGIGKNNLEINIDSNLNVLLLVGPNGFGKTTFFDAIEWALTGKITRIDELKDKDKMRFNKGKFINFQGDKENRCAEVSLVFNDGTFINRYNEKGTHDEVGDYDKSAFTYCVDKAKIKEQKEIEKYFIKENFLNEINFTEQFYYNHILGQDSINSFIHNYKGSVRQEKIFKMIGMEKYQDLLDMLNERRGNYYKFKNKYSQKEETYNLLQSEVRELTSNVNIYLEKCNLNNVSEIVIYLREEIKKLLNLLGEDNRLEIDFKKYLNLKLDQIPKLKDDIKVINYKLENNIEKLTDLKSKVNVLLKNNKIIKILNIYKEKKELMDKINQFEKVEENINYNLVDCTLGNIYDNKLQIINSKTEAEIKKCNEWLNIIEELTFNYKKRELVYFRYTMMIFYHELKSINNLSLKNKYLRFYEKANKLKTVYKTKLNNYLSKYESLKDTEQLLNKSSKINEQYKKALISNKDYIENNRETINNQNKCPLCMQDLDNVNLDNVEIESDKSNSEILIKIINVTLASGEESINSLYEIIDEKQVLLKNAQNELDEIYKILIKLKNDIYNSIIQDKKNIISRRESLIKKINNHKEKYFNRCRQEKDKHVYYEKVRKDIFNNVEFKNKEEMKNKINKIKLDNKKQIEEYKKKLTELGISFIDDDINLIEINDKKKAYEEHNKEIIGVNEDLKNLSQEDLQDYEKYLCNKVVTNKEIYNKLKNLNKTFFPDSFNSDIFKIAKKQKELSDLEQELKGFKRDKETLEKISENIQKKKEEIIKDYIEKNKLVRSLYEAINPHPYYRKLLLQKIDDGIELTSEGKGDRFFLDYIFSSAQNNVLALSIFLGFAFQQKWSKIDQIFIDDPIQNMDDINVLSFIDIIRSVFISQDFNKQIIISTHDLKLAELIRRKFRFLNMEIIRYVTYSKEGPIIKHYDKNLQEL